MGLLKFSYIISFIKAFIVFLLKNGVFCFRTRLHNMCSSPLQQYKAQCYCSPCTNADKSCDVAESEHQTSLCW